MSVYFIVTTIRLPLCPLGVEFLSKCTPTLVTAATIHISKFYELCCMSASRSLNCFISNTYLRLNIISKMRPVYCNLILDCYLSARDFVCAPVFFRQQRTSRWVHPPRGRYYLLEVLLKNHETRVLLFSTLCIRTKFQHMVISLLIQTLTSQYTRSFAESCNKCC